MAGHYNHSLFWTILSPNGGGEPTGKVGGQLAQLLALIEVQRRVFQSSSYPFWLRLGMAISGRWKIGS